MHSIQWILVLGLWWAGSGIAKAQNQALPVKYPSYEGLVMAGYQGWFNAPDDGAGRGWYHYQKRGRFAPGSSVIDLWPDVSEYLKTYKTDFSYADGTPAYVFSAYDSSTVDLHFRWMKHYGIDGVFMQRFVAEIRNPSGKKQFDAVLDHAMKASDRNGRAICIMYDLSGMRPGEEQLLLQDIDALNRKYDLLGGTRYANYLHENGRPLVVVWGVGFNDHRRYGLGEAQTIVSGLKSRGFSVMLGVPTYWREFGRDALDNDSLHQLIQQSDVIMPWFVGRYDEHSFPAFKKLIQGDVDWCKHHGVKYAPLAFPGFSWKNMNGSQTRSIDRDRGKFFWMQIAAEKQAGAKMLYIAMFDEVNEGTAIFKCATRGHVPLNGSGTFVGLDPDLGGDYYLWLAGQAARWFHGKTGYSTAVPVRH